MGGIEGSKRETKRGKKNEKKLRKIKVGEMEGNRRKTKCEKD